ncbi:MAG: hypothetical protein JO367_02765 [Actinobacteria bacterium]|nr:hypothetical protein [Actinomycetota bacterium]MBV8961304.1 hypothetical protein [Actinomycetota bacterium]MBV9933198.1 hypothetical protein [Actinomycetota bacterium]
MTQRLPAMLLALAVLSLAACGKSSKSTTGDTVPPNATGTISLTSTAFNPDGPLPVQFSCDGEGTSPPLAWSGVPKNATSLTLTVTDPDANGFLHWKVTGIPPHDGKVDQGAVPAGGSVSQPWRPACPPKGAGLHHYVFKLEAKPTGSGGLTATFERS